MTTSEMHILVEDYIGTNLGYLNHFSYSSHASFYHRYCHMDVDVPAYRQRCGTTLKSFFAILAEASLSDQAKIIRGTIEKISKETVMGEPVVKAAGLCDALVAIAVRLETDGLVPSPTLVITSETIQSALRDAELLLQSSGPPNAVDRAHTALHGYLKKICNDRGAVVPAEPSMTALFKAIKDQFPEFKAIVAHDAEARKFLGALASALDSLNTIRNRGTLAHPNDLILASEEAMLYLNLSRAVLSYLDSKLNQPPPIKPKPETDPFPF